MSESHISPSAFIGPGVSIGKNVKIGPGSTLLGFCTIEDDVWIGPGAHIGAPPEMSDRKQNTAWNGDFAHAGVRICAGAVIREGAIIHQGTYRETTVGPDSWVLNRAYIAHDVLIGHDVTLAAGVSIGGHCVIGAHTNLGMNAAVHQRTNIGAGCMVGMSTPIVRDLPPFVKAYGSPARIHGLNTVGMTRLGASPDAMSSLTAAYLRGEYGLLTYNFSDWPEPLGAVLEQWASLATKEWTRWSTSAHD